MTESTFSVGGVSKSPAYPRASSFLLFRLVVWSFYTEHLGLWSTLSGWVFVRGGRSVSGLLLVCGCPTVPALCRKNGLRSIVVPLLLDRRSVAVFMRVCFWTLYAVPLTPVSVLSPTPLCLDYCYAVLKVGSDILLTLLFSCNTVLAILGLLPLHVKVRIRLTFLPQTLSTFC